MKYIFVYTITLLLSIGMNGQKIIDLPVSLEDDNLEWNTAEREYMSTIWQNEVVTNVANPQLEIFLANQENNTGASVIICPGGGMYALSIESEGRDVARWLNKIGVSAFVLKYRLVPTGIDGTSDLNTDGRQVGVKARQVLPLATSDVQAAFTYIREQSEVMNIDPDKIGLMGFSAGGAVTMNHAYTYSDATKPNFLVPIYAWMNILKAQAPQADAPPIFVACASDDPLILAPASVKIYEEWLNANKPAELHMYSKGGHGFGMKKQNLPSDQWIDRFGAWLEVQGFLK